MICEGEIIYKGETRAYTRSHGIVLDNTPTYHPTKKQAYQCKRKFNWLCYVFSNAGTAKFCSGMQI